MSDSSNPFAYRRAPSQDRREASHHPIVIAGAGPVGLVLALDLAKKGQRSVVLDKRTSLSDGSRAICWAKRTLEIMGRLGLADDLIAKGVTWKTGKVFHREAEVFAFDLLPEAGHQRPAFINLQQFYFEAACVAAAAKTDLIDLRWGHEMTGLDARPDGVRLTVTTPDGADDLTAGWLVATDGARSFVRQSLGLGFIGQTFDDQFLICDIKMKSARPTERWFWFDPPFNPGRSALLHRQADDVWRLDFQIGPDADRTEATKPENVAARVRAMLGPVDFTFEWISCYRFQCRRLEHFRHGRVVFAGDAAHQVSPFGARGGNSGVQDADNLGWKLDLVLRALAPEALIDSYAQERQQAADENILNSTRATDFIAPKGAGATRFRDAVLELAGTHPFARRLLNSGRLSLPATYDGSPLNTVDAFSPGAAPNVRPGAPAADAPDGIAPEGNAWLLPQLGDRFTVLAVAAPNAKLPTEFDSPPRSTNGGSINGVPVRWRTAHAPEALQRYGAVDGIAVYLIRPDQHIAARWRSFDGAEITHAIDRATARA